MSLSKKNSPYNGFNVNLSSLGEWGELGPEGPEWDVITIPPFSDELRSKIDKLDQRIDTYYKKFSIPKRGRRGTRKICAPSSELKAIQRDIVKHFNNCIRTWVKPNVFGFIQGRTVADNAMYHVERLSTNKIVEFLGQHDASIKRDHGASFRKSRMTSYWKNNQKVIATKYNFIDITLAKVELKDYKKLVPKSAVRIDLKDAFGSVHKSLIKMSLDRYTDLSKEDIQRIIKACTLSGSLPQGAPTSPLLLNFSLLDFDSYCINLINNKVGKRFGSKIKYSRYADDITISSKDPELPKKCVNFVRSIAHLYGLKINNKKTRIMHASNGIFINGINIVNGFDHVCISRKQRSKIRAAINQAALIDNKNSLDFKNLKRQIIGRITYVNSLDKVHGTKLLKYAVERGVLDHKTKIHKMPLDLKIKATSKYASARSKVY